LTDPKSLARGVGPCCHAKGVKGYDVERGYIVYKKAKRMVLTAVEQNQSSTWSSGMGNALMLSLAQARRISEEWGGSVEPHWKRIYA